jgi:hypothetical protein
VRSQRERERERESEKFWGKCFLVYQIRNRGTAKILGKFLADSRNGVVLGNFF